MAYDKEYKNAYEKMINESKNVLTDKMEEFMDILFAKDIAPVIQPTATAKKDMLNLDYSKNKEDRKAVEKEFSNGGFSFVLNIHE